MRVSGIEDLRSRGFMAYSRGPSGPAYTVFVYPSAAQGPRAEGARPVVVHHQ